MNEEVNSGTKVHAAPEDDSSQEVQPSENEPTQEKAQHETLLHRIEYYASATRSIAVNALLLTLIAAIGLALAWEFSRDTVIVEPLGVPRSLIERGYTGEILARRLIDELSKIREGAKTRKDDIKLDISPDWSRADIRIPGAAMSLRSVVRYGKESFGADLRVSDEVTHEENGLRLYLRGQESGAFGDVTVSSDVKIDHLLHLGARELMKRIDPYILASYLKEVRSEERV